MKTARFQISIKNVDDIRALAYASTDHKIDGTLESPNSTVKANSILGLFTLDLSLPHILSVTAKNDEDITAFEQSMNEKNITLARC